MTDTSTEYTNALGALQDAYEEEYTDYSGTMSYLDGKRDAEISYLLNNGLSYLPTPPDAPPIDDFFDNAMGFIQGQYQSVVSATAAVSLKQFVDVLDSTKPTVSTTTFGELMGRVLGGQAILQSAADATLLAKGVANFSLGATAAVAATKVINADDPLDEAGIQTFALGGYILGGALGTSIASAIPQPVFKIGLMVLGEAAGYTFFQKFYDDALDGLLDMALVQGYTAQQAADAAYAAAQDYIDGLWALDGQDAQDLWGDLVNDTATFQGDLDAMAEENDWPPAQIPEFVDDALVPWEDVPNTGSPLVLDLDGDGIELTTFAAATTRTFFDIDGDSFAEQTAWVSPDDGFLVRDLNANSKIDNVDELFGSPSIDGFALLAQLDTNGDLIIDAIDEDWTDLRIWKDADGDAVTDDGELLTLASLNIVSIDLAGVAPSTSTISGNPISHTSTFKYANGSTDAIVDAWFVHDNVNTRYVGGYTLDVDALFLPTLRGFGELSRLDIAMSQDATLLGLVEDFADEWGFERFADEASLDSDFEDILFRWGGVDGVSPTSRGPNVDARKLEFMETFFGADYFHNFGPDPIYGGGLKLVEAWEILFESMKTQMLVQVGAGSLFGGTVSFDAFAGHLAGAPALSETAVDDLVAYATDTGVDTEAYWIAVARFLQQVKDFTSFTTNENTWMNDAIYDSDPLLTWTGIKNLLAVDNDGDEYYGTTGDDTLTGGTANDYLQGAGGNDTLNAGDGSDELRGDDGNDILNPGAGGDTAIGGTGDDIYNFSSGDDIYIETSAGGSDEIRLPSGIDSSDVSFVGVNNKDLIVLVEGLGSIQVVDQFFDSSHTRAIETLRFYDNSTVDLIQLPDITISGTSGNDAIGWLYLHSGTTAHIYGYDGTDSLYALASADVLDGGNGNDTLYGNGGNDTYVASPGFDIIADQATTSGDKLQIPLGYGPDDLTFFRNHNDALDMQVLITGLGQIEVQAQFGWNLYGGIETIEFASGASSINLLEAKIETRGGDGNDTLNGINALFASDDDILFGAGGNDNLYGDVGEDSYVFSEGSDKIFETSGTDEILFRDDTESADLTLYRGYSYNGVYNDLYVEHVNGSVLQVYRHFDGGATYPVEQIRFADSSTVDLTALNLPIYGQETADNVALYSIANDTFHLLGGNDIAYGNSGQDTMYGGDDNDTLYGQNDADSLHGEAGADTLYGDSGSDLLYGEGGLDTLFGGTGADTFVLESATAFNDVDIIKDFTSGESDVIDIADVLDGFYDPQTEAITDFVEITTNGSNSELRVDTSGSASFGAGTLIATIEGVTGLTDEAALVSSGHLLAA